MAKRIKVLLVQPNFHRYFVSFLPFFEPLVMIMLGSLVEDIAEVRIFDRRFDTDRALAKEVSEFKPDIIATRTHTSGEIFTARNILEIAKNTDPSVLTVIGGQHPTLLPNDFNMECLDLICIGPGEDTFRQIVRARTEGLGFEHIKGLAMRRDGELYFTEERPQQSGTFTWPRLNRGLVGKYKRHFKDAFTITSIGCPHRCNFCALWVAARGTYKIRDVHNVLEDIASMPNKAVYIGDDNTFHDHIHALKIYEGIKKLGLKKTFSAYARTDTIVAHPELFKKWREIGLENLVVGFEVVSEEKLKDINKKNTLDNNIKALRILQDLGIRCYAHFIIFPHFLPKDFDDIWRFLKKYKVSEPYFVPLTPLAGTPIHEEAKKNDELSILNYAFYNLEYMVYKTALPKWRFYLEYIKLWLRTISPTTFIATRKTYPFRIYLYRIKIIARAIIPYISNIIEQIRQEKAELSGKREYPLFPSQKKEC